MANEISFLSDLEIDGSSVTVDGKSLGDNAFNSTTIPTNNNQLTNGAGYVTSSGNTVIGTNNNINTQGATVISTVTLSSGVVTSFTTRTLTLGNLGFTGDSNANFVDDNKNLINGAGYIDSSALGNGAIEIKAGTNISGGGTFKTNQATAQTITINNTLTNNTQLTNGAGYQTSSQVAAAITSAFSGGFSGTIELCDCKGKRIFITIESGLITGVE